MKANSRSLALLNLCLLAAIALTPSARAQETIASDRPGLASGTYVLDPGTIQVEGGISYANAGPLDLFSVGQLLIRVGVPQIELQAIVNSLVFASANGASDEGLQDIGVGAKVRLFRNPELPLSVSGLATLTLPTGADFLTSDEVVPSAILLADYGVNERWTVSANLGYTLGIDELDDVFALIVTPSVSLPVEANAGAYFGYAGFYSSSSPQHIAEGGFTLLPQPDLQLDINGGVDIDTGDFFIGVGVATRWFTR